MLPYRTVVLELTEQCPHQCRHCYNYWRNDRAKTVTPETLSRREIRALVQRIKQATALEQVALSGGEPLLRSDLPGILQDLLAEGVTPVVITSGALLTPTRVKRLPPETVLEVTLFGADAELHDQIVGRKGTLKRVIEGVARARSHGCGLVVSVVVSALNVHEVGRALELGIALGAEGFLLNRMNLTPQTMRAGGLVMSQDQLEQMLASAEAAAQQYDAAISVSVPIPACLVNPARFPHLHFGWCPRGGKDAYYTVSHDGKLRPCNHSSRVLGDLRLQPFAELTEGATARAFWAPHPAECVDCEHPMRDLCRGGCPAASDECYGTRVRWDPVIELACSAQARAVGVVPQECLRTGTAPRPALNLSRG
ncbi:MAG TPA: radical SAM protein [Burkholderiaceae bacterium]|nr:radical SAM protein [Burkholderiaceae bacterium]